MNLAEQEDRVVNVLLIVGGGFHDFDLVRLELLTLLREDARIRTTCTNDWHDLGALEQADMVIAYTTNIFPDADGLAALRRFLDRGGRWLAIHGASAYIEFKGPEVEIGGIKLPGLTDTPDKQPAYMDLLGCRFVSHLAPQEIVVESVSDHPIVRGLPPFTVIDEPYIMEIRGDCEVLLSSRYTGEAPGYVEGPWLEDLPRPQALLHRLGRGEVLFLAPGHCIGPYDLRPFIDKLPAHPGPWTNPTYRELLRRAIRWVRAAASQRAKNGMRRRPLADTGGESDTARILRLATELDQSVDRKDWLMLRSFLDDPLLVQIGIVAGEGASEMTADAFVAEVAAFNLPQKIACHSFLNPLVQVTGDRATFTANRYGWNLCDSFDPPLYELWGRMAYSLRRTDNAWLIYSVGLEVLRDAGNQEVSRLRG